MAKLREEMDPTAPEDGAAPRSSRADRRRRPKIIVPILEDGSPDLSILSDEARAKLAGALQAEAEASAPAEPVPGPVVVMGLRALAGIEAAIMAGRMGLSHSEAMQAFELPPMLEAQLGEAGARVLAKYAGPIGKYQDEIVLAALLVHWQAGAFRQLREMAAEKDRAREREAAAHASPPPAAPAAPAAAQQAQDDWPILTERAEVF
jgi:hypothetical protein